MPSFVIAGGGLAAAKAAETLRDEGFDGDIVLVAAEPERPYERPPLSKGYLLGSDERDSIYVHPASWYAEHDVDLRLGVTVSAIDRAAATVTLSAGPESLRYDKLLLATGASPRRLDFPGSDASDVLYLRTVADSERLRSAFSPGTRVVIAGAGWIGLETAAAARAADCPVTVLEPQPGALHDQLGPELGAVFAGLHQAHGVDFRFGERAAEFRPGLVITSGGADLRADLLVVGIGAAPNDTLAAAAGLEVSNGVLTDAALRTSDPDIFAAGDVANSFHPLLGRRVRVEHWANALNGGPAAAKSMLGQPVEYDPVPYFYSDQYDLGMECAGLPAPGSYDQVLYRGDPKSLEFIAFWLHQGMVIAGMNVNVWDVSDDIQSLIRAARPVDPARLTNPAIPLPITKTPEPPLTGIRAPETKPWKLDYVIWAYVLNTFLQAVLSGFMWGLNRYNRPSWSTGTFVALACIVAGLGGLMAFQEGKRIKKVEGIPVKEEEVLRDVERGVVEKKIEKKQKKRKGKGTTVDDEEESPAPEIKS